MINKGHKILQYLKKKKKKKYIYIFKSLLALYPSGIPRTDTPSCEAPREPTIYIFFSLLTGFSLLVGWQEVTGSTWKNKKL